VRGLVAQIREFDYAGNVVLRRDFARLFGALGREPYRDVLPGGLDLFGDLEMLSRPI
jgi:hypothetical protein